MGFVVGSHSQIFTTKMKNIVIQAFLFRKQQLGLIEKWRKGWPNWFEQGPYNFSCNKRRPKKQNPRDLQFLIKDTTAWHGVNMCLFDLSQKIFFYFVVFYFIFFYFVVFYWSCCYTATNLESMLKRATLSNKVLINIRRVSNKLCSHLSKERRTQLLWARVLQFVLWEKEGWRSKAQGSCSFWSKESLSKGAVDMNELYCWIFNLSI